jgi:maltose O-acetyltransferase
MLSGDASLLEFGRRSRSLMLACYDQAWRIAFIARARIALWDCEASPQVYASGPVHIQRNKGRIIVGSKAVLRCGLRPPELLCSPKTTIRIGPEAVINYGTRIDARAADITVGARCLTGSWVRLIASEKGPIILEDDVWIAHGAVIEGGVRIGAGSVIAAAAVVKSDVPPGMMAVGNPARPMSLDFAFGSGKEVTT